MKKSILRQIIKESIDDIIISLELGNGAIVHGIPRKNPRQLNLQIGKNGHFSFWDGEFSSGGNKIVKGVDDRSQEWLDQAVEEYKVAERDSYPEKYGLKEDSYKVSKNSKQAQQLKKGDIITSGDEVISVSSGVKTPSGKVEVTLKNKKGITRTSTWGKTTMIGVKPVISETYNDDGRNPYNGFLSTDDTKTVIVRNNEDWEKLATSLNSEGFKHPGSLNPLNPNKELTQMYNYAKFPYEVVINKTQKLVDFGEHSLSQTLSPSFDAEYYIK
jgi:hypothetical protein